MLEYIDLEHSGSDIASVRRKQFKDRCNNYHPLASHLCVLTDHLQERAKGRCKGAALYERTDPLLLALLELCSAREATLKATVVVQLYLELYEAAGMPNRRHTEALKVTAKAMRKSLSALSSAASEFEEQPLSRELTSEPGQACLRIADEVIALGDAESRLAKGDASPKSILRYLLVHFPLLCGRMHASMSNNFYLDGIQMSQYESGVTAAAHLYRATKFVGRSRTWTQLEVFMDLQGKELLGISDADDEDLDPFEVAVELSIALGIPRSDFEENALKNGGLTRRLPLPYMISSGALALPMIQHSLLRAEQQTQSQSDRARITSPDQSRRVLQRLADTKMSKAQMAAAHPNTDSSTKRRDSLGPAQLLEILSESLAADAQHLNFNHHGLTLSCWELHRMIVQIFPDELQANRNLLFKDDGVSGKFNVVDEVLWEAVASATRALESEDPEHPGTMDAMLFKVLPAFDEFIKRQ